MDCLRDGQVFILGRCCDKHAALGTAGLCDGVVPGINLVHKLERLAGEHIYLHPEGTEQLHTVVGFSAEKRVPHGIEIKLFTLAQSRFDSQPLLL